MTSTPLIALLLALVGAASWAQTSAPIAGLHPDRRPDGAPRVAQFTTTDAQAAKLSSLVVTYDGGADENS